MSETVFISTKNILHKKISNGLHTGSRYQAHLQFTTNIWQKHELNARVGFINIIILWLALWCWLGDNFMSSKNKYSFKMTSHLVCIGFWTSEVVQSVHSLPRKSSSLDTDLSTPSLHTAPRWTASSICWRRRSPWRRRSGPWAARGSRSGGGGWRARCSSWWRRRTSAARRGPCSQAPARPTRIPSAGPGCTRSQCTRWSCLKQLQMINCKWKY